jgi:hypothetical protein
MSRVDSQLSDPDSPWDESSDDQSNDSLSPRGGFAESYRSIRTILDQLARISLAIQKSGAKHRFKKADALLGKAVYADFRSHLTFLISPTNRFPASKELSEVQERLIHANIMRRNRIEQLTKPSTMERLNQGQADRRQEPIPGPKEASIDAPLPSEKVKQQVTMPQEPNPISQSRSDVKPPRSVATHSTTRRTVSSPGSGLTANVRAIVSKKTRSVATKVTNIGASVEYPRCPRGKAGEFFKCPYCNSHLPPQYREEASWM